MRFEKKEAAGSENWHISIKFWFADFYFLLLFFTGNLLGDYCSIFLLLYTNAFLLENTFSVTALN